MTLFTEWGKKKEDCGLLWAFSGLKRGTYARSVYWGRQEKCEYVNFKNKYKNPYITD